MQTDFEDFFHRSEHHYLQKSEILLFRQHIGILRQRLATYEALRNKEIEIFQAVANQLEVECTTESTQQLGKALKHWICVMRYCAMAMLLNNPEFLQHRLLEWLTDIVTAHQMQTLEQKLYEILNDQLTQMLPPRQNELIKPFLQQAQQTLLSDTSKAEVLT
ncbi:phycobilisome protein [Aphanothece hegewaldii CCALA 016]|uniref:Phycobilisome protein n=1 Tax=Aphanothece hegewaldii CCALA 016 TaxID=2107694 RepID=A0A2T1M0M1_9CHRO|nr:phycobilisome protein [Aphanothece hegewaldii]PSF38210.1 phycobilisome protein [Aphanothece hegewaldii CCALA 016]